MRIKRWICLLAALALALPGSFPAAARAEKTAFVPDPAWWGKSRDGFLTVSGLKGLTETVIDRRTVLVLRGLDLEGGLRADVYFRFGRMEAGKKFYGLDEIVLVIPPGKGGYTKEELRSAEETLHALLAGSCGEAARQTPSETVWELDDCQASLSVRSFRAYTGSRRTTAGVVWTRKATYRPSGNKTADAAALRVYARAECLDENRVGSNWSLRFTLNGEPVRDGAAMTFRTGDTLSVRAVIREEDGRPDEGENSLDYTISGEDLSAGRSLTFPVYVRENSGRYAGYTAVWRVTFTFYPVSRDPGGR